ncbi:hypothetical protein CDD80_5276 [Ophiocordyceps camponoti-rufipedis]|uniref:Uncharacterized protein n=1 Tax=Ophiocordyceps camponoti-rufipedis TaxID=2004952 RepID=A0A2C5YRQ1_9HYPO|nr:hypothetical protein CDD80_5276 [Ophiocordyceps camponoti-rufipedis]
MLTRSGGEYKMTRKQQSRRRSQQTFRSSKGKSSTSTYSLRRNASEADVRLWAPSLKGDKPVNEFPGHYINPVKLRALLMEKYKGHYAVEMRYDVYKIYAKTPLLDHEISCCY